MTLGVLHNGPEGIVTSFKGGTRKLSGWTLAYPATLFACFLTFAHLFFAAFAIAALAPQSGWLQVLRTMIWNRY